jgi:sortase A
MRWAGPEREAAPSRPFLARLEVPAIALSALVVDGVDDRTLLRAVGRLPKSARPGEPGNVALAGHRDTDFRALRELKRGDRLRLRTYEGEFAYEVEWIRIVKPQAVEVVAPTDYPALTLVTCYPFRYVGRAPMRYVVRAREVERPDPYLARS